MYTKHHETKSAAIAADAAVRAAYTSPVTHCPTRNVPSHVTRHHKAMLACGVATSPHPEPTHTMTLYNVTADHVSPEYAVNGGVDVVYDPYSKTYAATTYEHGCGKSQPTPEQAIRSLLLENGCSNITIH